MSDYNLALSERQRWAVVSSTELGWIWHIPIQSDLTSVGLVTTRETLKTLGSEGVRDAYLKAISETYRINDLLEGATFLGDRPYVENQRVNVIEDWAYRCDEICGAGWYCIGDGAMFVDPILASGLTLASSAASMVANAITTLEREPQTDPEALRASLQLSYSDIASAYHRMARVWYRQNERSDGWHWQARQERLRSAGRTALFENDADAFTAVCLGVLNSPLNATLDEYSEDILGAEYFTWITTDWLFGQVGERDDGRSTAQGLAHAQSLTRRGIMDRWRRMVDSKITLSAPWEVTKGFHTSRFVDTWKPIRYVSVDLNDPVDPDLRVACPHLRTRRPASSRF